MECPQKGTLVQRIYTERRIEEEGVGADALRVCVRAGEVKNEDGLPQVLFIPIFGA